MKGKFIKNILRNIAFRYLHSQSTEELTEIFLSLLREKGALLDSQGILFRRILTFRDKDVRDIMIPRGEIFAVPANKTLKEVMPTISEKGFSRIPAFEGSLDKIVGMLYVKDIAFYFPPDPEIKIKDLLRQAHFVSETMKLNELYREFKKNRVHIAVVLDEYGSVSGLVTLEDLLEEIFGEIEDEYDVYTEPEVKVTGEGEVIALGRTNLEKLFEILGEKIHVKGIDTVNGLLCYLKNGIPQEGDSFDYGNLRFTVIESTPRQAKKVLIQKKFQ